MDDVYKSASLLLKIDTNRSSSKGGGVAIYNQALQNLRECLQRLPDTAARKHSSHLLDSISLEFESKTVGSWRPFIVVMLQSLGIARGLRVTEKDVSRVAAAAAKLSEEGCSKVRRKRRAQFALENTPAAKKGIAQETVTDNAKVNEDVSTDTSPNGTEQKPTCFERIAVETVTAKVMANADIVNGTCPNARQPKQKNMDIRQLLFGKAAVPQSGAQSTNDCGKNSTKGATPPPPPQKGATPHSSRKKEHDSDTRGRPPPPQERDEGPTGEGPTGEGPTGTISKDMESYYHVLHLEQNATQAEIRAAYRKRALTTHPDKGGTAEEFRRVVRAFEILSDSAKQTKTVEKTPAAWKQPSNDSEYDSAKAVFATILITPPDQWTSYLKAIEFSVLNRVVNLIDGMRMASRRTQRNNNDSDAIVEKASPQYSGAGLKRLPNGGWWVQVAWRRFKVTSVTPIKELDQAISLHIMLVQVRDAARARLGTLTTDLAAVRCELKDGEDCPVCTHADVLSLLRIEPGLLFSSDLSIPGRRIQSPWTPSLESALHFRAIILRVLAQKGDDTLAKRMMSNQAKRDKEQRFAMIDEARKCIIQEVNCRQPPRDDPLKKNPTKLLALTEVARLNQSVEDLQDQVEESERLREEAEKRADAADKTRDAALRTASKMFTFNRQNPLAVPSVSKSTHVRLEAAARESWERTMSMAINFGCYPSRNGL